jgi:hypothetical protein
LKVGIPVNPSDAIAELLRKLRRDWGFIILLVDCYL